MAERLIAGTGASRQRAAYERTGSVECVVEDLVARTATGGRAPAGSAGPSDGAS